MTRVAAGSSIEIYNRSRKRNAAPEAALIPAENMPNEISLLERIADGDRSAVALCIQRYSGLVWSLARRFIPNDADAEEAVQDVFLALWSGAGTYDAAKASEATWISMVARRRLIDRARKEDREPRREALADVDHRVSVQGQQAIEASAESTRVLQVIDSMEPQQRDVIRCSTWLGMTHAAIAEELNLPLGTVKSHLRRGLSRIREQLGVSEDREARP